MSKLIIYFSEKEKVALINLAEKEIRNPSDQAKLIIINTLINEGFLPKDYWSQKNRDSDLFRYQNWIDKGGQNVSLLPKKYT